LKSADFKSGCKHEGVGMYVWTCPSGSRDIVDVTLTFGG
jgi:hypothetical protein